MTAPAVPAPLPGWPQPYPPPVPPFWVRWARPALAAGPLPAEAVSLGRLADTVGFARRVERLASGGMPPVRAASALVHQAIGLAFDAVVGPLVADGLVVVLDPDRIGFASGPGGAVAGRWADPSQVVPAAGGRASVADTGAAVAALVLPVAEAARRSTHLGPRSEPDYVAHRVWQACVWLHGVARPAAGPGWIDDLLAGAGWDRLADLAPARRRTLVVHPDAGPPVTFALPRRCCAGAIRRLIADPCPTCNLHPDDEARASEACAWLASLTPAAFERVTGRPPVGR